MLLLALLLAAPPSAVKCDSYRTTCSFYSYEYEDSRKRWIEVDKWGNKLYHKPQFKLENGKVYKTDSLGRKISSKPLAELEE